MVAAKSARATDISHRWEWTVVQAPDVAEAITLRTPQIEKLYAPPPPRLTSWVAHFAHEWGVVDSPDNCANTNHHQPVPAQQAR